MNFLKNQNYIYVLILVTLIFSILSSLHIIANSYTDLTLRGMIRDDSFYYATIIRNFHNLSIISFDGQTITNGFQPLFLIILYFSSILFSTTDLMTITMFLNWFFWIFFTINISILLISKAQLSSIFQILFISFAIFTNPKVIEKVFNGQETTLILFCISLLALYLKYIFKKNIINTSDVIILAIISCLCFYARLDFFIAPLIILTLIFKKSDKKFQNIFIFMSICMFLVLPYISWNILQHNDLIPISSLTKKYYLYLVTGTFGSYFFSNEWTGLLHILKGTINIPLILNYFNSFDSRLVFYLVYLIYLVLFLIIMLNPLIKKSKTKYPEWLNIILIITLVHTFFMQVFYLELRPYQDYYFIIEVLIFFIILSYMISKYKNLLGLGILILTVLIIYGIINNKPLKPYNGLWKARIEISTVINKLPDKTVAGYWPGAYSWFSKKNVLPMDGIVSDKYYLENVLKLGKEIFYLKENKINYLILPGSPDKFLSDVEPNIGTSWPLLCWKVVFSNKNNFEVFFTNQSWTILKLKK